MDPWLDVRFDWSKRKGYLINHRKFLRAPPLWTSVGKPMQGISRNGQDRPVENEPAVLSRMRHVVSMLGSQKKAQPPDWTILYCSRF